MTPGRAAHAAALCALALAGPRAARANGHFPQANQPVLHPSDPARLAVRTTFGALMSADGGNTFRWICENVAGYGGVQDPTLALFGDASVAFAADEGLRLSHDGACSFAPAPGLPDAPARDLVVDRANPARVAALVTPAAGRAAAFLSEDGARSFRPAGPPLPEGFEAEAIELGGARLYVSGAAGPPAARRGLVARLDEGGAAWALAEVALEGEASLYLAALDPTDPDRAYARADGPAADRLLVSEDAGASFRTVVQSEGRLLGFALSPAGDKVAVGGPGVGVLVAERQNFVFTKKSTASVLGLAWGPAGLFAAANDFAEGFVLARSGDEGATFAPVLRGFLDVLGPLDVCPPGGPYAATCVVEWPALRRELGGDAAGGGGGAGAGPAGGALAGEGPAAPQPRDDDGCSSGAPSPSPFAKLGGALVVGAALALGRRARRRR